MHSIFPIRISRNTKFADMTGFPRPDHILWLRFSGYLLVDHFLNNDCLIMLKGLFHLFSVVYYILLLFILFCFQSMFFSI